MVIHCQTLLSSTPAAVTAGMAAAVHGAPTITQGPQGSWKKIPAQTPAGSAAVLTATVVRLPQCCKFAAHQVPKCLVELLHLQAYMVLIGNSLYTAGRQGLVRGCYLVRVQQLAHKCSIGISVMAKPVVQPCSLMVGVTFGLFAYFLIAAGSLATSATAAITSGSSNPAYKQDLGVAKTDMLGCMYCSCMLQPPELTAYSACVCAASVQACGTGKVGYDHSSITTCCFK